MHDSVAALPFVEDEHAAALEGMRVLLADDTPANQDVISRVLRAAGAEVVAVGSGRRACHEAMDAFQSARPYHVVLMDVQMPELDGLSATTKLRGLGYPGAIVALTASIGDDDRGRCITVGCDDVARKPIERGKLIALLSRWAPSVSGAAGGAGQHSQVGAGATDIAAA
jgi:CheY-like chemotaxis protein